MSTGVFFIVLFSAALHATWNAIVKGGPDKQLATATVCIGAAAFALVVLPFAPSPERASWPFIAVSALLQVLYFRLLAAAYHLADMGLCYPIMRGTAPLLVALASCFWIGDALSTMAWVGVLAICAGILCLALGLHARHRAGALLALLNAFVIAAYTLTDGLGVRRSSAPLAYTLWIFLLTGLMFGLWTAAARRRAFVQYLAGHWRAGLIGGVGSAGSYGIALWAMTVAPLAIVAALRETSILFGILIAIRVLKEKPGARRMVAIGLIALGAVALRAA
jgi:drug/metabolite transporter (DMT)-like permease